jgi:hypothetical protein
MMTGFHIYLQGPGLSFHNAENVWRNVSCGILGHRLPGTSFPDLRSLEVNSGLNSI